MPAWVGLGIAGLLAVGPSAVEQRLDWQAVEGCPSAAAIAEATDRYLGQTLADYPRAVLAEARVEAAGVGYRVRLALEVDGRREQHERAGPDCDQLGRDVALLIASAVDPFAQGP